MTIRCETVQLSQASPSKLPCKVAIIIPAYNEAEHIEGLVERCQRVSPTTIVVVNDASTDQSKLVLRKLQAQKGVPVTVLHNEENLGKQGSVRRALRHLIAHGPPVDAVALIDGDGQHDPAELPGLAWLLPDYDVVIGARSHAEMPIHRRLSNSLVNMGYALFGGVDFVDVQSGLRLYLWEHARVLGEHLPQHGGYGIEHESLALLARHAQQKGQPLRVAAATISCSYGAASSIRPQDLVALAYHTVRQALRVRRYQQPLPVTREAA